MTEAEITCNCPAILLADLQLSLTRDMVVYLDATIARGSKDLARAVSAHGVSVKYVQRFRERRPAAIPAPQAPVVRPPPQVDVPVAAIAQQVAALLEPRFQEILRAIQALSAGRGLAPVESPGRPGLAVEDAPVYIPAQIGREDLQPVVAIAEAQKEGEGVADAVAALQAARKTKGRK